MRFTSLLLSYIHVTPTSLRRHLTNFQSRKWEVCLLFEMRCYPVPEKAMAPHSSTLAWRLPWTEEPGRLQSMGLLRVGHYFTFTFTFHFYALEKEMATHSSVFAWRIPGTGEPGGLLPMGSHRVGHDWSDLAAAAAAIQYKVSLHMNRAFYCSLTGIRDEVLGEMVCIVWYLHKL